jgi:hypothetical protein
MQSLRRLDSRLSTALAAGMRRSASSTAEASTTIIADRVQRGLPVPMPDRQSDDEMAIRKRAVPNVTHVTSAALNLFYSRSIKALSGVNSEE